MAETNFVYVNPQDNVKASLVMINGFPFTVRPDPAVTPGTVAMNSIQRKCCSITTTAGDTLDLNSCVFEPKPSIAAVVNIEVEYIAASKKGGTIDCKAFSEWFIKGFKSQYFVVDQMIAAMYDASAKYIVHVRKIGALSADSKNELPYAQIAEETKILISTKEKCEIALVNVTDTQIDATQQQIINPFNLEKLGIGGLRAQFGEVFRRAFASRIFPRSLIKKLGINHVKGVLLFGPPGTGKTLIARKIGEILNCRPPKIVNGPEVFNKFVGGTEENVRKLFEDAEADQLSKGDQSPLHLIIFDEFDAICKQRGAIRDSTGVADNVVNQLLSKIDGVSSLNNVLLIGMTNRKDLIDEAILRPGRFEVHVEIGLPDEPGRVEIFRIHTRGMRENKVMADDVSLEELAAQTKNFSGAEIEGVVRSATSHAFNRHIDFENPAETIDAANVHVSMEDFRNALQEVTPAFGQAKDECESLMRNGIIDYGPTWKLVHRQCEQLVHHLQQGAKLQSLAVLLEGFVGCGKSAIAAHLATISGFPFVKVISSDTLVGYGEMQKANILRKAFEDAYKSPYSAIILDDMERLIEYSALGARYSNILLQSLLVLIKRQPPEGHKLLVIGTTSQLDVLQSLELAASFSLNLHVPGLDSSALAPVVAGVNAQFKSPADLEQCIASMPNSVPIKKLILLVEMATDVDDRDRRIVTYDAFASAMLSIGLTDND